MSPGGFDGSSTAVWRVGTSGYIDNTDVDFNNCLRTVLNLTTNTQISTGDGTKENPFVVE